jgi:hypothetical protein
LSSDLSWIQEKDKLYEKILFALQQSGIITTTADLGVQWGSVDMYSLTMSNLNNWNSGVYLYQGNIPKELYSFSANPFVSLELFIKEHGYFPLGFQYVETCEDQVKHLREYLNMNIERALTYKGKGLIQYLMSLVDIDLDELVKTVEVKEIKQKSNLELDYCIRHQTNEPIFLVDSNYGIAKASKYDDSCILCKDLKDFMYFKTYKDVVDSDERPRYRQMYTTLEKRIKTLFNEIGHHEDEYYLFGPVEDDISFTNILGDAGDY